MPSFQLRSAAEQVAGHLRGEILRRRWVSTLPGVFQLARDLGVSHKTVGGALCLLETEGLLEGQGAGRNRRIASPSGNSPLSSMRVGILLHDTAEDRKTEMVIELRHALTEAGHVPVLPRKTLLDLKMDVRSIARTVQSTEVDAWVIYVASREVLQWFAGRSVPAFAMAGRQDGVPIAGTKPNMPEAYAEAARHLVNLGHQRVVLLCRTVRRVPEPGRSERAFLKTLETHGVSTGSYNLPDWDGTPEGLHATLDSLFQVTPPTALLIDEPLLYTAVRQSLSARGLQIPGDVSLVCSPNDSTFAWCRPSVAHIDYDPALIVRRMVRWVANVSRGRPDIRQTMVPATFVAGGSVAAPPGT